MPGSGEQAEVPRLTQGAAGRQGSPRFALRAGG